MNFFDNITTTATVRPPRMGIGSLGTFQKHTQFNKANMCLEEEEEDYHYMNYECGPKKYFPENDTKSSKKPMYEKVNNKSDLADFKKAEFSGKNNNEDNESEPEWFSYPASRHDFIDLHGFEEDNNNKDKNESQKTDDKPNFIGCSNQRKFFDAYRNDVGNRRHYNNNNNINYQNRNYNRNSNQSSTADKNHAYQGARFRNPLHQPSCKFEM